MAKTINCIKELETKHVTFKLGEIYAGNKINDNYWIVDSVGIETKVFEEHFKASIEDKTGEVAKMVNAPDKLNWAIE